MGLFKRVARTRERTATTGTADLVLLGTIQTNDRDFATWIGDTNFTTYCLISGNGIDTEEGIGTVTVSGGITTLSRDRIFRSTNSGSKIDLTGDSRVFCNFIPGDLPEFSGPGWYTPCNLATTGPLPANSYSNGSAGIGATLTATGNGLLVIDGINTQAGYRILVKNEVTPAHNGIYVVTNPGGVSSDYVLTRTFDFNSDMSVLEGGCASVGPAGTSNGQTIWQFYTSDVNIVFGTTDINWVLVGSKTSRGLDAISATLGDVLFRDVSDWAALAIGSENQVLTVVDGVPVWANASGGGGGDVNWADFIDAGTFNNTGSYIPGKIVTDNNKRFINISAVDAATTNDADAWNATFGSTKWSIAGLTATAIQHNATDTIIGTKSHSSGIRYAEFLSGATGQDRYVGIAPSTITNGTVLGNASNGLGFHNSSVWRVGGTFSNTGMTQPASGHVIGLLFDLDNGLAYVRDVTADPNSWFGNNGAADPVAGTNGFPFTTFGNAFIAVCSNQNGSDQAFTYQDGSGAFAADPPIGGPWGGPVGTLVSPGFDTDHWTLLTDEGVTKAFLDAKFGTTRGSVIVRTATDWIAVTGTSGQIPTVNGSGDVVFADPAVSGGSGLFNQILSAKPTSAGTGLTNWLNQGTATVSDAAAGILLKAPSGSDNLRGRYMASPSTPYTKTALVAITSPPSTNTGRIGFGWYDGSAKLQALTLYNSGANNFSIDVENWATVTTFNAQLYGPKPLWFSPVWLRISDDGTTVSFQFSSDGMGWVTLYSVAKSSGYLGGSGYSNVVFFANGNAVDTYGSLLSFT